MTDFERKKRGLSLAMSRLRAEKWYLQRELRKTKLQEPFEHFVDDIIGLDFALTVLNTELATIDKYKPIT